MLDQGQVLRCAFTHTDLANSRFFALSNAGNTNPSSMAWLTVTFRQIYTGHLICFTSCTESFTSQCIPRQANFISITFGVENRLHLCSIYARWMRHKWGIVWNPPKKWHSDTLYLRPAFLKTYWNPLKVSIILYFPPWKTNIKGHK